MRVVNLRVCLNRSFEIAVVPKEIVASLLGDDHSRLVVRILIGKIYDLQESSVRERLDGFRRGYPGPARMRFKPSQVVRAAKPYEL